MVMLDPEIGTLTRPARADDVDLVRDRDLVERYQHGDIAAFEELYRRYRERLVRYCQQRVGNRNDAEELAQEAFVRALGALPRLDGDRRFYPWLTVIASRLIIDSGRARTRCSPSEDIELGATDGGTEAIVERVDFALLDEAMGRLNARHREVLELRERRGWSYQDIADHYDVTQGTVEQLIFRARKALRREFLAVAGDGRLVALPVIGALLRRMRMWGARFNPSAAEGISRVASGAAAVAFAAASIGGIAVVTNGGGETRVQSSPATGTADASYVVADTLPGLTSTAVSSGQPAAAPQAPAPTPAPEPAPTGPVTLTDADTARDQAGPIGTDAGAAAAGGSPHDVKFDVDYDLDDYQTFVLERLQ